MKGARRALLPLLHVASGPTAGVTAEPLIVQSSQRDNCTRTPIKHALPVVLAGTSATMLPRLSEAKTRFLGSWKPLVAIAADLYLQRVAKLIHAIFVSFIIPLTPGNRVYDASIVDWQQAWDGKKVTARSMDWTVS